MSRLRNSSSKALREVGPGVGSVEILGGAVLEGPKDGAVVKLGRVVGPPLGDSDSDGSTEGCADCDGTNEGVCDGI